MSTNEPTSLSSNVHLARHRVVWQLEIHQGPGPQHQRLLCLPARRRGRERWVCKQQRFANAKTMRRDRVGCAVRLWALSSSMDGSWCGLCSSHVTLIHRDWQHSNGCSDIFDTEVHGQTQPLASEMSPRILSENGPNFEFPRWKQT